MLLGPSDDFYFKNLSDEPIFFRSQLLDGDESNIGTATVNDVVMNAKQR